MTPSIDDLAPNPSGAGDSQLPRHFGWMLHLTGANLRYFVHPLPASKEVLREYEDLTKVIATLQPLAIALAMLESEHDAISHTTRVHGERLNALQSVQIPHGLFYDMLVEATARVAAFLASASALLDQMEHFMAKHFGEHSHECEDWNAFRRQCHGESSAYRILYQLRHYSQHYGLPVSALGVKAEVNADASEVTYEAGTKLNRDALLSSGFDWKYKDDLRALPVEFAIGDLTRQYASVLRRLFSAISSRFEDELTECNNFLDMMKRVMRAPEGAILYLFWGANSEGGNPPTQAEIIPIAQFEWVQSVLNRSPVDGP